MSNVIVTPNMNLPNAVPGVDPGPDYANNNFSAFSIIDQHNHTVGNGVQLTPASLNINSALTMNYNDLTNVRTVRFLASTVQPTLPTDLGCIYEFGVDLYYNDQNGNPIQITKGGVVNISSTGQITGITGTASASYSAGTFVFQSATTTPANIDGGSIVLRNILPSSKGLTLSPPNAMASNYGLTLPNLPASTSVMTLDASGNMASISYDAVGQNMTFVGANAIGISMDSAGANAVANSRTRAVGTSVGAGGVAISPDCGSFSTTSTSFVTITNLSVSIVTTGRPVMMFLQATGAASLPSSVLPNAGNSSEVGEVQIAGTTSTTPIWEVSSSGQFLSGGNYAFVDTPPAGTQTYSYQVKVIVGSMEAIHVQMVAYEL